VGRCRSAFLGPAAGPPEERYASKILDDLIAKAFQARNERPLLVLYVHVNNARAIAFYQRSYFGFVELHKPYTDPNTGWQYKRMVLVLDNPVD
jgi:ribosomal protein S18 acetylase RimI-like enzyme